MTEHTPVPWVAERERDGHGKHVWFISNERGDFIAEGIYNETDAKLIAASPELLDIVKFLTADNRIMEFASDHNKRFILDTTKKAEGRDD